ncbi:MAG: NADH:flavin oxidoreductase, partial [Candidatus Bathyarchaeia archaeon]
MSPSEMMLFSPIKVGPITLENRIVFAPTDLEMTPDGYVSDLFKKFNLRRAKAGLGLIILGGVAVTPSKSGHVCRINSDEFVPGLKELADLIHSETKTKLFIQLTHFLKLSRSGYRQKVEDLTYEDLQVIKSQFVAGAIRAKKAGYDGVELHYAHAYTMASLLSRLSNKRTDMYGRTLEGRLRFPIEVLRAVREAVGKDFVVGARINGDEFISGGNTLQDSIPISLKLAEEGLDYLSISVGGKFEDAAVFHGKTETQPGVPDPYSGYSGQRSFPW